MVHPAPDPARTIWRAYGMRDALIFAVGFALALILAAPFTG